MVRPGWGGFGVTGWQNIGEAWHGHFGADG
jgi:hypothetical protein